MDQEVLELITGVRSGKNEDFETIKAKYKPLISDLVNSFEASGAGSVKDLTEEAERALIKAVLSFDTEKKGITFGLYAKICIRNALISARRARAAEQRRKRRTAEKTEKKRRRAVLPLGELEPEEMLSRIENSLSDYEASVLREFFSGKSARETAETLGTDEKSVYNAVFRIRQKAKEQGRKASDKQ